MPGAAAPGAAAATSPNEHVADAAAAATRSGNEGPAAADSPQEMKAADTGANGAASASASAGVTGNAAARSARAHGTVDEKVAEQPVPSPRQQREPERQRYGTAADQSGALADSAERINETGDVAGAAVVDNNYFVARGMTRREARVLAASLARGRSQQVEVFDELEAFGGAGAGSAGAAQSVAGPGDFTSGRRADQSDAGATATTTAPSANQSDTTAMAKAVRGPSGSDSGFKKESNGEIAATAVPPETQPAANGPTTRSSGAYEVGGAADANAEEMGDTSNNLNAAASEATTRPVAGEDQTSGGTVGTQIAGGEKSAAPSTQPAPASTAAREDSIRKGDVLRVTVPELDKAGVDVTTTARVKDDGTVELPLINGVESAGLTPDQLKKRVADRYRDEQFIPSPTVTVERASEESRNGAEQALRPQQQKDADAIAPAEPAAAVDERVDVVIVVQKTETGIANQAAAPAAPRHAPPTANDAADMAPAPGAAQQAAPATKQ
jgi:hypothetical protein